MVRERWRNTSTKLGSGLPIHCVHVSTSVSAYPTLVVEEMVVGSSPKIRQLLVSKLWWMNVHSHFMSSPIDNVITLHTLGGRWLVVCSLQMVSGGVELWTTQPGGSGNADILLQRVLHVSMGLSKYADMGRETSIDGRSTMCFTGMETRSSLLVPLY